MALWCGTALNEDWRAIFRSPPALGTWSGGASPDGGFEGLLPIEGGVKVQGRRRRVLREDGVDDDTEVEINHAENIEAMGPVGRINRGDLSQIVEGQTDDAGELNWVRA